jgi:hypothetical protein
VGSDAGDLIELQHIPVLNRNIRKAASADFCEIAGSIYISSRKKDPAHLCRAF